MKPSKAQAKELADRASAITMRGIDPTEVESLLVDYDDSAVYSGFESQYTTEIWDGTSPINGVPADKVKAERDDIPDGGAVLLIRETATGNVIIFQPHLPQEGGIQKMTPIQARDTGKKMIDERAKGEVQSQMIRHVMRKLESDPVNLERRRAEEARVETRVQELLAKEIDKVRDQVRRDETERILREARSK